MSRNIIGDERTRRSILSVLRTVNDILPVSERLVLEIGSRKLTIKSGRKHVPDFVLKFRSTKAISDLFPASKAAIKFGLYSCFEICRLLFSMFYSFT